MEVINYTTIPTSGIVSYLPFDGNATAKIGSNGASTNVTWGTNGTQGYQKGYAIVSGNNSYINSNQQINPANPTTIAIGFKRIGAGVGTNAFEIICGKSDGDRRQYIGYNETYDTLGFGYGNKQNITIDTGISILDNVWYFVVGTWDGTNFKGYLNGDLVFSDTYTSTSHSLVCYYGTNATGSVTPTPGGDYFNGHLTPGIIYNRVIDLEEVKNLTAEFRRKLGPTNAIFSGDFPLYSLPNLEQGKILEISKPKVGSNYINQVDGSSYAANNVTDSTNGKYNVMSFNGTSSDIDCGTSIGNFNNQDFAVGARVYNNDSSNEKVIIARYDYDNNKRQWYLCKLPDNRYNFRVSTGVNADSLAPTSPTMPTGVWQRVIGTYQHSNKTLRLYVNGIKIGELAGLYGVTAQTQRTGIGRLFDTPAAGFWNGNIVLPFILDRLPTDTEILQDYYAHKIV